MPSPQARIYTIEDIYNLPEGERAELIDGQIYYMAPPSPKHQEIVGELFATIRNYIKQKGGSCKPYISPFAVYLDKRSNTYVEPDISVICNPDKLTDKGCEGAPDWIIEVVSPSSRKMDYSTKNTLYSDAGVREYWIVDPLKERTTIYQYENDAAPVIFPFSSDIAVGIYKGLSINIAELL